MSANTITKYQYQWPVDDIASAEGWSLTADQKYYVREMPESKQQLANDSRWPAFFPSPICFVTTSDGVNSALEKVVGATIVNRFPYVITLSFCKEQLSDRHHVRKQFTEMLERGESVAVQFLPPGRELDVVMNSILKGEESETEKRIAQSGLSTRKALTNDSPVFDDAYLVYEARLVKPGKDFNGEPIFQNSWIDQGSHRIYFLEISAIQLREDIARGESQVHWKSLPEWSPELPLQKELGSNNQVDQGSKYQKGYTPNYAFPSAGTVAFEADCFENGMAVKHLPPLPEDQVEIDNDRARWPCFFPSSAGMITCWSENGEANLMPCGSTAIVSRHPLVIAPCVCYAGPNERYARRASLDMIRRSGKFGCGVPFINETVIQAIRYAGNISLKTDADKVNRSGLQYESLEGAPMLPALPIHFDCKVVGEVALGTHIMFLGEVQRIYIRADVSPQNPLKWTPWADVKSVS